VLRLAVLIALTWATPALAKPTVAVAPIGGDSDDEVTEIIVDVLGDSSKVIKPKQVVKAIGKLGIAGELDAKDAQKLQRSLKADAVVQGRVRRDGRN
jgi:TolB-like protein